MRLTSGKRNIIGLIIICFSAARLVAADWKIEHSVGSNFAYYFDNHDGGIGDSAFLPPAYAPIEPSSNAAWKEGKEGKRLKEDPDKTRKLGSGWGAVEIEFFYEFKATTRLLSGNGTLTENNNLKLKLRPVLTPVSAHLEAGFEFTPIAFFVFKGGMDLGTGWRFSVMNLEGLTLNNHDSKKDAARGGLYSSYYIGGRLQFDLATIFPGEYNHIVLISDNTIRYKHNTSAGSRDAWYWRADDGRNFNSWVYHGNYILGWLPPWKNINFTGFKVEHKFNLSEDIYNVSKICDGGWGSNFHSVRFGPFMSVNLSENHSITFLLEFKNGLYYTERSSFARWFERYEATGKTYVKFDRLALAYTWKL